MLGDLARLLLQRLAPELKPEEAVAPISSLPGLPVPALFPLPNLTRIYIRCVSPVTTGFSVVSLVGGLGSNDSYRTGKGEGRLHRACSIPASPIRAAFVLLTESDALRMSVALVEKADRLQLPRPLPHLKEKRPQPAAPSPPRQAVECWRLKSSPSMVALV